MPATSSDRCADVRSEMSSKLILVESTRSDPEFALLEIHEAELERLKQGPTKGGQTGSTDRRDTLSVEDNETRIACGGPPTVSDATGPDRSENIKSNVVQLMLLMRSETHKKNRSLIISNELRVRCNINELKNLLEPNWAVLIYNAIFSGRK